MKIAYVTNYPVTDVGAWSGIVSNVFNALVANGLNVSAIDNLLERRKLFYKAKKLAYRIFGKNYLRDREPAVLHGYAAQADLAVKKMGADVVFSPGTLPVAYLKTTKPLVIWTDATFGGLVNFYPLFSNLCAETLKAGHAAERSALQLCRLAIFASEWAAETAIKMYGADPAKVKVVPFGANIRCDRTVSDIRAIAEGKNKNVCKLLFLGVDWTRKGGDHALAVAVELSRRGLSVELHVAGCYPPAGVPEFVKQHGFISKKTEAGQTYLNELMLQAHFMILPSVAECFGVVFAEASSFGLPSLASDVGGIPSAVKNGRNGQIFPLDSDPSLYADYIQQLMNSKEEYLALSLSSFEEYQTRLNWKTSVMKVQNLIVEVC